MAHLLAGVSSNVEVQGQLWLAVQLPHGPIQVVKPCPASIAVASLDLYTGDATTAPRSLQATAFCLLQTVRKCSALEGEGGGGGCRWGAGVQVQVGCRWQGGGEVVGRVPQVAKEREGGIAGKGWGCRRWGCRSGREGHEWARVLLTQKFRIVLGRSLHQRQQKARMQDAARQTARYKSCNPIFG